MISFKRTTFLLRVIVLVFLFGLSQAAFAQNTENWTKGQLMEPAVLAQKLKEDKEVVVISVGPGALIPQSIAIGPAQEEKNLEALETKLKGLKKDTELVIYCGCCPFEHCPNVRPAIGLLQKMEFTNYKLLNLPHNIKADWLDKGYPKVKL